MTWARWVIYKLWIWSCFLKTKLEELELPTSLRTVLEDWVYCVRRHNSLPRSLYFSETQMNCSASSSPCVPGSFSFSGASSVWRFTVQQSCPSSAPSSSSCYRFRCRSQSVTSDLKFVLHEALDSSGIDSTFARVNKFRLHLHPCDIVFCFL